MLFSIPHAHLIHACIIFNLHVFHAAFHHNYLHAASHTHAHKVPSVQIIYAHAQIDMQSNARSIYNLWSLVMSRELRCQLRVWASVQETIEFIDGICLSCSFLLQQTTSIDVQSDDMYSFFFRMVS